MVDEKGKLSRLKIAKKAYIFDLRKKYAASRTFQLKKKAETPADQMKEAFTGLLEKRRGGEKKDQPAHSAPLAAPPPSAASSTAAAIKTVALVVLLFILGGALFLWLQLSAAGPEGAAPPKPDIFSGSYSFSIEESEMLSVAQSDRTSRSAFFLVSYKAQNLTGLNFTAKLFAEKPTTQVFLLDYAREGDDSYPTFRRKLLDGLAAIGLPGSEIDVEHLAALPEGATLIVPTGYLPKELLGIESSFDYKVLLHRGVNIIYMGYPFDTLVLDRNKQTISVGYGELAFTKVRAESAGGFRLYDPQYTVSPQSFSETGLSGSQQLYGSVSLIRGKKGSMLFLPQTLDGGWRGDGEAAAQDVVRLVRDSAWIAPLSQVTLEADPEEENEVISLFSPPFDTDSGFVEFSTDAVDNEGIARRSVEVFRMQKVQRGEMIPRDSQTIPFYLSGQRTRLNIKLAEPTSNPVELFIRMYKDGELLQEEKLELGLTNPQTEKPKDFQVNAEPGRYVVHVEDRAGKIYAASQLDVIDMDIDFAKNPDWGEGKFAFALSAAGTPVSPRSLAVSLDGKGEKKYASSSFSYGGGATQIEYEYPSEIKPGNHTFIFTAGDWAKSYPAQYKPSKNFWDNPLVIVLGLVSALVFGVGVALRKPEHLRYGVDIPDFPPLSTIKIPMKKQTVLEVFESVNASYAWQYMPLRTDELKNGFRRLTYNGKPILVGDFNLERILAKLRDEGLVKDELGYWGKAQWEKDSGKSMHYLAIYRIMRNVFVNNAMKFSKLGAMTDCDVKAIEGKDELYLHIMETPYEALVHRALATAKRGTTMMVFKNEEERDSFVASLTSTSKLAVALKMEVNNGNIHMVPVKNAISAYLRQTAK